MIENKIANSGLNTLDLEKMIPSNIALFDIKDYLFRGLILKEKDFREALKTIDWSIYQNQHTGIFCSTDAIIPMWAYMLVVSYLQPVASAVYQGSAAEFRKQLFLNRLSTIDATEFDDKRVVIKGCGDQPIGEYAYFEITRILLPHAKSIMYGEPCSTVPVFKKR